MARITLLLLLHLLFLLLEQLAISAISSSSSSVIQPQCESSCGGVSIPYPFGIGTGCFIEGLEVTCEEDVDGSLRPFLYHSPGRKGVEVIDISLPQGQVRVSQYISYACYNESGYIMDKKSSNWNLTLGRRYQVSAALNTFVSVGCDIIARIKGRSELDILAGCLAFCYSTPIDGSCTGTGCCQASIAENLRSYAIQFFDRANNTDTIKSRPCNYGFVAKKDWFQFDTRYLSGESFMQKYSRMPLILEWTVGDENCAAAKKNASSYACRSANSVCIDSTSHPVIISGPGYICNCTQGYQGDPYLLDGCEDIDECKQSDQYPCYGNCTNTEGGYNCTCPPGTHSKDPTKNNCDPDLALQGQGQGLDPLWVKASLDFEAIP